jgi:Fur family peroxide stress response transcriptional regulator
MSSPSAHPDTNHACNHETEIRDALRLRGYRITEQRSKIIKVLCTTASPKTAKEIGVRTKIKDASTVYRTLSELVKEGLVEEFQDRGIAHFEVAHEHHDHAVCNVCGSIVHIPCTTDTKPKELAHAGWVITSHEAIYHGTCASCAKS